MKTLAERLSFLLKEKKLSQRRLGKLAGVSNTAIYRWATGITDNPGEADLERVASTLGTTESWLRTGVGPMKDHHELLTELLTETTLNSVAAESPAQPTKKAGPLPDRGLFIQILTIVLQEAQQSRSAENIVDIAFTAYDLAKKGKTLDQIREKVKMWFS